MSKKDTRLSLDEAVEYLKANPKEIDRAWRRPSSHPAGGLFKFVRPNDDVIENEDTSCGCPTMIKSGDHFALDIEGGPDKKLTTLIRRQTIPANASKITVADLPKFAKIQKMVDDYYKERGWRK
jgi:hypothetical protein